MSNNEMSGAPQSGLCCASHGGVAPALAASHASLVACTHRRTERRLLHAAANVTCWLAGLLRARAGIFPAWLVTSIPQVVASCQCAVGINLDSGAFTCPAALPRLSNSAQATLRRFGFLQCVAGGRAQPLWQLTAAGGGSGPMTRAAHKAAMQRFWEQQQAAAAQPQRRHTTLGAVCTVLGLLAAAAGAALTASKARTHWRTRQQSQQAQVRVLRRRLALLTNQLGWARAAAKPARA